MKNKFASHRNFIFFNYPVKYSIKEYVGTVEKIGKKYLVNNIEAVYTDGTISNPGISDIDIILVAKNSSAPKLKFVWLNKNERNMVCHPFYIIDRNTMKNIRWMYPDFKLELVKGKKIDIKNPTEKELKCLRIFLMVDIMIRHFPRDYLEMTVPKLINVRNALLRLNALNHSISTFGMLGIRKKEWDSYAKEVKELRNAWFEISEQEKTKSVVKLLKNAILISMSMIDELSLLIKKEGLTSIISGKGECIYNGSQNMAFFVEKWDKHSALKRMAGFYMQNKKFYSVFPLNLLPLLMEYSKGEGLLSSYMQKNLENSSIDYEIKCKGVIRKRIYLLNMQAHLAYKMKHLHFTAFFDYGYKSTSGILNKCIYAARKIKNSSIFKETLPRLTGKSLQY